MTSGDVDYTSITSLTLTFPMGSVEGSSLCATVNITDDDVVENNEVFSLSITSIDTRVSLSPIFSVASVIIHDSDGMLITLRWYGFPYIPTARVLYTLQ